MTEPTTTPRRWSAWHLHLATTARGAHDRVLTDVIGPTVRALPPGTEWFFIRYWQSGPHLRLRIADLAPCIEDCQCRRLDPGAERDHTQRGARATATSRRRGGNSGGSARGHSGHPHRYKPH